MNIFQKAKVRSGVSVQAAGRGAVAAGGSITGNVVTGNGNRTAFAGSHHNVFADSTSSISQINNVTVKQRGSRVDVELPDGYTLYINGERTDY